MQQNAKLLIALIVIAAVVVFVVSGFGKLRSFDVEGGGHLVPEKPAEVSSPQKTAEALQQHDAVSRVTFNQNR